MDEAPPCPVEDVPVTSVVFEGPLPTQTSCRSPASVSPPLWGGWGGRSSFLLAVTLSPCPTAAGSSVMSCVSCFFLSFGNSESAMIALLCLFGGVSIASWNALDVLTVELYPSDKRCGVGAAGCHAWVPGRGVGAGCGWYRVLVCSCRVPGVSSWVLGAGRGVWVLGMRFWVGSVRPGVPSAGCQL